MTIGIGDFVIYLILVACTGFLFGWILGMGDGYKQSRQDIRRLKRQMDGHKYEVGDIVQVAGDVLSGWDRIGTVCRVYHLLDGDHDYQILFPGEKRVDVDEEDIARRISKGVD